MNLNQLKTEINLIRNNIDTELFNKMTVYRLLTQSVQVIEKLEDKIDEKIE